MTPKNTTSMTKKPSKSNLIGNKNNKEEVNSSAGSSIVYDMPQLDSILLNMKKDFSKVNNSVLKKKNFVKSQKF